MPNPATLRERRLRMTRAQLIDEIDTLEQRAAALEAANRSSGPMRAKANERHLANQQLAYLARFTSESPNPVLRAMPDGTVLYANDAAIAVNGLLQGPKKSTLAGDLTGVCAEASNTAEVRETEFESGDRVFAFSIAPVADETYINVYGRDTTERKRAEQALLESEERFRSAFETAAHGMNLTTPDGRFLAVNKALCELLGYSEEELLATDVQSTTHPEDIDRDLANLQALLAGEIHSYQLEKRYVHKQGRPIDVLLSMSLIRGSNGEPLYSVGHIQDITERKHAEEELARKEAQLRVALDNMPGGIRFVDEDGNYVFFNDRYLELYDFPGDLLKVGEPLRTENLYQAQRGDFGPGDPEALTDEWLASRPRETKPQSWERTTVAGKVLQVWTAPTPDGGFANIVTDITERKRAEEALRKSQQRLKDSIEALADGFALHDADDSLVLYNGRYAELLFPGTADALKSGTQWEANLRAQCAQGLIPAADGRLGAWIAERRSAHLNPKGPVVQERSGNAWIRLNERKAQDGGIVTIVTDITELKRAEQRLREKSEFLQLTELITRAANEATNVDEAVQIALDQVCVHTGWPVGHAYLLDESAGDLAPSGIWHLNDAEEFETFRSVTGATRFASGVGLPGRVLASGQPAWIFDVTKDPNFPGAQLATEIGVRAGAAFPVLVGKKVAAVLEFFSDEATEPDAALLEVMAQVGTQLGRVVERKHAEEKLDEAYRTISDQKERMEDELNIGREIQMSMVPQSFPAFPNHHEFAIHALLEPAREVGGDFYDFFFIDEERFCACIGDVSGKGVPAALFMAVTKTLVKSRAADDLSTASILTHVNSELSEDNQSCMFVTIFLGILNIRTGQLTYTNAGHNPPYLRRNDGSLERLDTRHGPLIGAVTGLAYEEQTDALGPGDLLFMYTDGVTEEMNSDKQLFSEQRMAEVLASAEAASVEAAVRDTVAAVRSFKGETPQSDDITVLALQFLADPARESMAVLHIVVKNDLAEIATVNAKFREFAEEHDLPAAMGQKMGIAFDDLLNNVVSYAFPDEGEHKIDIRAELAGKRLTVTISDDGIPFNPLGIQAPDTSVSLEGREGGGLGIHLVRSMVDDISYRRRINRNVLSVVMHMN